MNLFKKFIGAIAVSLLSHGATASPVTVNIIWGFSPSVSAFNHARHMVQQANENQKKYQFVLDSRPGAAGLIAARQVLTDNQSNRITILMTSNAFFARPYLYKNPGYTFDDFSLLAWNTEVPIALVMKKGRNFEQILRQPVINLSMVGTGSMTHVMAEQFRKMYPQQVNLIGYHGTREGVKDVIGGNLDLAFDLLGSVVGDDKVEIVGITGNNSFGYKRLADLGPQYSEFKNMGLGIYFLVPRQMPVSLVTELHAVISRAQQDSSQYKTAVQKDFGTVLNFPLKDNPKIYQNHIDQLKRLTRGMEKFD
jgi:tripartite-type tricarboxylate transporter receptor subunit TctC